MITELYRKKASLINIFSLPVVMTLVMITLNIEYGIVLITTLGIAIYIFYFKVQCTYTVRLILLSGFLSRVVLIMLDQSFHVLPYNWDDYFYNGVAIKENIINHYPLYNSIQASLQVKVFSLINALIYWIVGNYESIIRVFCAFWGILAVERLYRITQIIELKSRESNLSILIITFLPSFIIFSSLNMRDALIIFLSFDLLYRVVYMQRYNLNFKFIILFFDIVAIYFLRKLNIVLYLLIFAIYILIQFVRRTKHKFWSIALILVTITGLFIYFQDSSVLNFFLSYSNREVQWRSAGGAVYLPNTVYHSYLDIILWLPVRFFYFTFGPMPWQIDNAFMLMAFLESAFILFFLYGMKNSISGLFRENGNIILFIFIFCLISLMANAVIDSNYGTAIRHKLNYILPLIPLASPYWKKIKV
ncbi:hypothetical protein GF407_00780 [candidate division KSB1 bacterium]|nr:hypothetical protein [candidate division KSB1 bacterium]